MEYILQMGADFDRTVAELGQIGDLIVVAADEGLGEGVQYSASHISDEYLTGQYLKTRSGNLKEALQGWKAGKLHGVIGIVPGSAVERYAWLLGDETKVIRPKKSKYLVIPIGENLTGSGNVRWASPRDKPEGFFIESKGQLLFGYRKGKTERAKFRPLFVLKKEVTVFGSGALTDGMEDAIEIITGRMNSKISAVLN